MPGESVEDEALRALVQRYHDRAYCSGLQACRARADAEDVVQEAFTTLARRLDVSASSGALPWPLTVGLSSPYLKNSVVARVNFLRFKKDGDFEFDETIGKLLAATKKIDPLKVNKEDIAKVGGSPAESTDE